MKLTLQIKLLPTNEQEISLLATIKKANEACNKLSEIAWGAKTFNNFKLQRLSYHQIKDEFNLTAQVVVRCIAKVADSYKLDKKTKRTFRPLGGITYDSRILSIKNGVVNLWSVDGRLKMPFICHNVNLFPYIKGEADLIYKNNKWYLFQTVEAPEEAVENVETFIGCDFGITNICVLSTGEIMTGKTINDYRSKRQKVRSSLQSKGTKGCKKVLKRLSGKEKRTASIVNHTIAKKVVGMAKHQHKGVALENLKGIRKNSLKKGKAFRSKMGKWNFSDLRQKISYKAQRAGVPVVAVAPKYTSQICHKCGAIGSRNGESFKCKTCGYSGHADINAARNIAARAAAIVNQPEETDCVKS